MPARRKPKVPRVLSEAEQARMAALEKIRIFDQRIKRLEYRSLDVVQSTQGMVSRIRETLEIAEMNRDELLKLEATEPDSFMSLAGKRVAHLRKYIRELRQTFLQLQNRVRIAVAYQKALHELGRHNVKIEIVARSEPLLDEFNSAIERLRQVTREIEKRAVDSRKTRSMPSKDLSHNNGPSASHRTSYPYGRGFGPGKGGQ